MPTRYHIEELVSQDASGVVFRAVDSESGRDVSLRRFFPHGPEGGGLHGQEKTAYLIAIQRLAAASHPGLRSIVDGGCDPVDGVPFVVTELVAGEPLSHRLASGPLASRQAIDIIMRALEVSDVISELLAEQAIWVETNPATIIDTGENSDRGVTFWMSPLKWLGPDEEKRSLRPIAALTEDLMGWRNKLVNDQAGNNLAGWLKWLKQHADRTTIAEARETLAAATGAPPPPPTSRLVRQATRPLVPRAAPTTAQLQMNATAKKSSKLPAVFGGLALLAALGIGGWIFKTGQVPFASKFLPQEIAQAVDAEGPPPAVDAATAALAPSGPFQPGDLRPLLSLTGKPASVEGILARVRWSETGRSLFLEFENLPPLTYACGTIRKTDAAADMNPDALASLIGKKITLTGIVGIDKSGDPERPQLFLKGRESIAHTE